MRNQTDRILREQRALTFNLVRLEKLGTGGAAGVLVERAIESVRDAIEALERAVDESEK